MGLIDAIDIIEFIDSLEVIEVIVLIDATGFCRGIDIKEGGSTSRLLMVDL